MLNRVRSMFLSFMLVILFSFSPFINVLAIDWGSYQKDESRSGFSLDSLNLPLKLGYEIDMKEELSGGILINGNDFFFTTRNGIIGSGNSFSGLINWKRRLDQNINSCAVLSQFDIFTATMSGNLYCLSQKTGAVQWITQLEKPISAPLLIAGQYLYTALDEGKIVCINRRDGSIIWITDLNEEITSGISYKNFYLYTVTNKGKLACINGQSGEILWSSVLETSSHCTPIVSTESIYVGDDNGNLYCFDTYSDKLYFKTKQSSGFNSSMALAYYDQRMMIAGLKDQYIGLVTGNGHEAWSYKSDDTSVSPAAAGRQVFVQGSGKTLVALDSFDGKELFHYPLHAKISTGLSIGNGKVFLGTETGKILIFTSSASDFQFELTPSLRTISLGEKTQFEIDIQTTEYFTNTIFFSVSGFPCSCRGVSRSFDEQGVSTSKKINLIIETANNATEGRYNFSVMGTAGNFKRVAYGVLLVTNNKQNTLLQINPPSDKILSGENFSVDILLSEAKNMRSISFTLDFPPEAFRIEDVSAGNFYKGSSSNLHFDKVIDNINGKLTVGFSQKSSGESGNGTIASIVFKAVQSGTRKLSFSQVSARDTFQYELLVLFSDAEITVAPGVQKKIVMTINKKTILIDNQSYPLETPPVIENSRALTPLRILAENLDTTVSWDSKEQKITLVHFGKVIELWINQDTCLVNGVKKAMPSNVPPRILYNRTYVPLRFIADELNATVLWEAKTQTITILYPK